MQAIFFYIVGISKKLFHIRIYRATMCMYINSFKIYWFTTDASAKSSVSRSNSERGNSYKNVTYICVWGWGAFHTIRQW